MTEATAGENAVHVLRFPIKAKTRAITELTLRRPLVGDLRKMSAAGGDQTVQMLTLLQRIAGLAPDEVDLIDLADLEGLSAIIAGFTEKAGA